MDMLKVRVDMATVGVFGVDVAHSQERGQLNSGIILCMVQIHTHILKISGGGICRRIARVVIMIINRLSWKRTAVKTRSI